MTLESFHKPAQVIRTLLLRRQPQRERRPPYAPCQRSRAWLMLMAGSLPNVNLLVGPQCRHSNVSDVGTLRGFARSRLANASRTSAVDGTRASPVLTCLFRVSHALVNKRTRPGWPVAIGRSRCSRHTYQSRYTTPRGIGGPMACLAVTPQSGEEQHPTYHRKTVLSHTRPSFFRPSSYPRSMATSKSEEVRRHSGTHGSPTTPVKHY
ncbi:hypothetical protein V8F20_008818 [Naviculisporaceae sp. PSN 640]